MQSLFVLQVVRQPVVPLQTYGEQLDVVWVPQVPAPVQSAGAVKVDPEHDGGRHWRVLDCCVQAPAPLQVPVFPQGGAAVHCVPGAGVPAGSGAQLPGWPLTLQAWQVGQVWLPQHTPSVQNPLIHWFAAEQTCPLGFSAQLRLVPDPWQVNGATQSASPAHDVLQIPPLAQL